MVDLAGIAPGFSLLDVACGRGAVLLAAASTAGSLTGIDVSPAMIERASTDLRAAGIDGFQLRVMDAEQLEFPDAGFDALTAAFMLFFLPHPDRAAAEFRRVLRPGGSIAVSTWAEDDDRWAWAAELLAAAGTPRRRALQQPFDRAEDVIELFAEAGFEDLRAHHEPTVTTLREASFREMAGLKTARGYPMRLNAWVITGATHATSG
jgi:ubiquinone/menaquinone biosynthesis C-methylase UbiE